MAPSALSPNDENVLEKLKDPEFAVSGKLITDDTLPRDPNIMDDAVYDSIVETEKAIVNTMINLDREQITRDWSSGQDIAKYHSRRAKQVSSWLVCILKLDKLIENHPDYASARNNRVQALRTLYGDGLLVKDYWFDVSMHRQVIPDGYPALDIMGKNNDVTMESVARKVLKDLNSGIELLSPKSPFAAVSPTQARTLAQLYTQRGQLYKAAARKLGMAGGETKAQFRLAGGEREAFWSRADFEEHASSDLFLGGRYGNDVAKKVAVQSNPMAKLCGQIVSEAMRKEFAGGDASPKVGTDKNTPAQKAVVQTFLKRKREESKDSDEDDAIENDADDDDSLQKPAAKVAIRRENPYEKAKMESEDSGEDNVMGNILADEDGGLQKPAAKFAIRREDPNVKAKMEQLMSSDEMIAQMIAAATLDDGNHFLDMNEDGEYESAIEDMGPNALGPLIDAVG